ncbi:MAG: hypothetical protein QG573_178 [Acidobacteriota bacterium]|nr:hypothetical protein [Acidobacteriota bacterium]
MVLFRSRRRSGDRAWFALVAALASFTGIQEGLGGTPANAAGILFLDHQGFDSSINNTSSIIGGTRTLLPFDHGDAAWAEHLACVQATFAPYDITVTDVDPGAVAHWEVPVAGTPTQAGFPSGTAGVSPFTCGVINNGVAFSFANIHANMKELCWTTAQESVHLFGLDHEALARDPMTYITGCLEKRFAPEEAPCGEFVPRACACGGATQNSDAMIANVVGRAPAGAPLMLNNLSVSQDGFDEIGSTCQWTAVVGEESAQSPESATPAGRELICGTESRLLELSRAQDARARSRAN